MCGSKPSAGLLLETRALLPAMFQGHVPVAMVSLRVGGESCCCFDTTTAATGWETCWVVQASPKFQGQLHSMLPARSVTAPHTHCRRHTSHSTLSNHTQGHTLNQNRTPDRAARPHAACGCMPSALMTVLTSLSPRPLQLSTTLVPSASVGHSFCSSSICWAHHRTCVHASHRRAGSASLHY